MDVLNDKNMLNRGGVINPNGNSILNLVSKFGIKWLEYLENEFDKQFIDLDKFLNLIIENNKKTDEDNLICKARNALNEMNFIFTQLTHKCLVVFDSNSQINSELHETKKELLNVKVQNKIFKRKLEENFNLPKLHESNNVKHSFNNDRSIFDKSHKLKNYLNLKTEINLLNDKNFSQIYLNEEINNLRKENLFLQKYILNLKSELFGIRLIASYFNKELSGRVQQIQLLKKSELNDTDQSTLWNQIETEIQLSKHKTVIKACRERRELMFGRIPNSPNICNLHEIRKKKGICDLRDISINLKDNQSLGISITGGKEFGIPIIISEIHYNTPASTCGNLYVGDSILNVNEIDFSNVTQSEAANILLNLTGKCDLKCVFVITDFKDDKLFETDDIIEDENEKDEILKNANNSEDEDDNYTSITSTLISPNKMYPGGAKPLFSRVLRKEDYTNEDKDDIIKDEKINCREFYQSVP